MHSQVHSFIAGSPPSKREFPRDRATIDRIEAECASREKAGNPTSFDKASDQASVH